VAGGVNVVVWEFSGYWLVSVGMELRV
jgi:hypothetical protein